MIAALNAAGLDMATLGNHEFDFGIDVLLQRMAEARWQWVISNVIDTATGKPIGGAAPYVVRTFGSLKVGFIGLCLTAGTVTPDKLTRIRLVDAVEAAGDVSAGAEERRGRSHRRADASDVRRGSAAGGAVSGNRPDRRRSRAFPDHRDRESDADQQGRIRREVRGENRSEPARFRNRRAVLRADSDHQRDRRRSAHRRGGQRRTCPGMGAELDVVVGSSRVPLEGRSVRLRASETNLGNLVADAMRADAGADIAILNSGAIRGDRLHQAGPLTRRTLLEIHPFGNVVCKVEVSGPDRARGAQQRGVEASRRPPGNSRRCRASRCASTRRLRPVSGCGDVRVHGAAARSRQDLHRRDSRFRPARRR